MQYGVSALESSRPLTAVGRPMRNRILFGVPVLAVIFFAQPAMAENPFGLANILIEVLEELK